MQYKIIEIKPDGNDAWKYMITDISGDREEKHNEPSALGYYYYPVTMSDEQAFVKLRDHMVNVHTEKIAHLKMSIDALNALQY